VSRGSLELGRVRVLRDLHYTAQGSYATDRAMPYHVPDGQLFVLGDLSSRSRDSRYFGPVPVGSVRGRPIAVYRPFRRAAWLDPRGLRR
jgi:type IV secretory pathway protease TraF